MKENAAIVNQYHVTLNMSQCPVTLIVKTLTAPKIGLSSHYLITITVHSRQQFEIDSLIKCPAVLTIQGPSDFQRLYGYLTDVQGPNAEIFDEVNLFEWTMTLASPLYLLHLNKRSQVFCNVSVQQAAEAILMQNRFTAADYSFRLVETYPAMPLMVQYNETDLDFFHRRLEHFGLFYCFNREGKLIITDDSCQFNQDNQNIDLPFTLLTGHVRREESAFAIEEQQNSCIPNVVTLRDYNPEQPDNDLTISVSQQCNKQVLGQGEDYRYGENYRTLEEGGRLARVRMQSYDWQRYVIILHTDCPQIMPGQVVTLSNCLQQRLSRSYRVINVKHVAGQRHQQTDDKKCMELIYHNELTLIPVEVPYKPPIRTAIPVGSFGRAAIEAYQREWPYADITKEGSYWVKFDFDHSGRQPATASPPLRLAQTLSGENYGMHFPLKAGTEVVYACINGDVDRPVLIGCLPNHFFPSPVTQTNRFQHIIRTQSGNAFIMSDKEKEEKLELFTQNQQQYFCLSNRTAQHTIRLASEQGDINIAAQHTHHVITEQNIHQQIGQDQTIIVQGQHQIVTKTGNIRYQQHYAQFTAQQHFTVDSSKGSITLKAQEIACHAQATMASHANKGDTHIIASQGNCYVKAEKGILFSTEGNADIRFNQPHAQLIIHKEGAVSVKAKKIEFHANNNIFKGKKIHLNSHDNARPVPAKTPFTTEIWNIEKKWLPSINLRGMQFARRQQGPYEETKLLLDYRYIDGSAEGLPVAKAPLTIYLHNNEVMTESLNKLGKNTINHIIPGNVIIKTPTIEICRIEHQSQKTLQPPWFKTAIQVPDSKNSVNKFNFKALWPAIIKNYYERDHDIFLTERDLHYFKTNGNNIMIFIHGYNVELGQFGCQVADLAFAEHFGYELSELKTEFDLQFASSHATTLRNSHIIQQHFPEKKLIIAKEKEADFDHRLNGSGMCNWLVHIEDNLNRATKQFDRTDYTKFTRVLGIAWSGTPQLVVDYMAVQQSAINASKKTAQLIIQLKQAGLTVNIIAHSLGNAVLVHAMEHLAKQGCMHAVDHAFMWEAAIPDNCLSSTPPQHHDDPWYLPNAHKAAKKITVLYSENDNILGSIPPNQGNQAEINHSKPFWEELVPALLLTQLKLGSVYELAMWIGVPVTQLLHYDQQVQFYQQWIKRYPKRKDGALFKSTFAKQIEADEKKNQSVYSEVKNKLENVQDKINQQLEASGHKFSQVKMVEAGEWIFEKLGWLRYDPIIGIAIDVIAGLNTVKGLLTLYNVVFVETGFQPRSAMGYKGPDNTIQQELKAKLQPVNQTKWLWSHSGMKIPSQALMAHVYMGEIIGGKGTRKFGQYSL